ncbi:class I SAM-dependent methyltransferase [Nannocystis bainbridge]|uniref:Methyltransferase n=1 Tax=Nannocystis bainbridge TaxID=2995303 RepID=A0ABT5EAM2_9BACT|nr:methyltransferase [Nannocystis bainbridge]MDC0722902.1 methyltransferase [Nannocystis bainbridge]
MFLRTALRSLSLTALVSTTVLPGCASKPATSAETPAPGGEDPAGAAARDADPATVEALKAAIAGPQRSAENRARDVYRHPLETLLFFGLKKDQTVVELWPGGGGWFTEVLAPTLRDSGKLIVTNFDPNGPADAYQTRNGKKFLEKLASAPEVYDKVEVVTVTDPSALVLAPENSVDLVVTFRNTHGWVENGIDAAVYSAAFKALKPGGVLGVEAHRGKPQPVDDPKKVAETGYLPEDWVVARVESFGFKLQARSEINANPKDTKDYEKGVWTLPPSFELGDKDRDKYAAIGESDRMTLKFVKP